MSEDSAADGTDETRTDGAGAVEELSEPASLTTTDGTFYVVKRGSGHELFTEELAAIEAFGDHIETIEEVQDTDQVREIEIGEDGDDWIIRRLTWQDVARRLLDHR